MFKSEFIVKLKWSAIFFVIYSIIFFLFSSTLSYTFPFIIAFVLALWIKPLYVLLVDKLKLNKSFSALISTIVIYTSAFTALSMIVYKIIIEIRDLAVAIPKFTVSTHNIVEFIEQYRPYYDQIDPSIANKIQDYLVQLGERALTIAQDVLKSLIGFALSLPVVFMIIFITLFTTYFFIKDMPDIKRKFASIFSAKGKVKFMEISKETNIMFIGYLKSYMFIIFLTFLQTYIGFSFLKVRYSLILSILSAFFDILPILGVSAIYLPLSLLYFVLGEPTKALIILLLYFVITTVRHIVEPKIISASLGLHPVSVLAAIFIGLKMNGFTGMVYLIFLMVFYKIFNKVTDFKNHESDTLEPVKENIE